MIYDLNKEIPPCDVIKYTIDGKEYIIPLEVSDATAYWLSDRLDDIRGVFGAEGKPRISRDAVSLAFDLVLQLFKENYPEVDEEWVKKHINVRMKAYILVKAAVPIIRFVNGLVENFTKQMTNA